MNNKIFNLLIIDDDKDILLSLENSLSRIGYFCHTESDPVKALEIYRANKFDAVITDIRMEYLNGLVVIRNIVKRNENAKIIVISAYKDFEFCEDDVKKNVFAYFSKPINFEDLVEALEKIKNIKGKKE